MKTKPTRFENGLLIGLLAIGLGTTIIGPIVFGYFKREHIRKNGIVVKATILNIIDTGHRHNGNPVVRVKLLLQLPNDNKQVGERHAEAEQPISVVNLSRLQPGMIISVSVDSDDFTSAVIIE